MTKGKGRTPGAGGLGKHIKSVAKRERAQPESRKHLGPLEKRKDHQRRAKKRKARVARVQQLKRAAATRNPDEFHVKMTQMAMDPTTGKMKKHDELGAPGALAGAVRSGRLDAQFLERKARADMQRARELTGSVGGLDLAPSARQQQHTVFVDTPEDVASFKAEQYFNTTKQMLSAPALRGSADRMAKIRVGHALDHVDDATLLRRFHRGDFSWDDELEPIRSALNGSAVSADDADDDDDASKAKSVPLQGTRTLRDSLLGPPKQPGGEDGAGGAATVPPQAVLLRMIRRAAVLEAQHDEQQVHLEAVRAAREITERVKRSKKLAKLEGAVRKRTIGHVNRMEQKQMQKFRPGAKRRMK